MLLFGNSEVVLRFIPALLGVLTIPLIYLVGKEFMDRNTGIIAAAAFTFSPFLIFYSQEARAYSMMLFFVTFSMVFYFRALKSNDIWTGHCSVFFLHLRSGPIFTRWSSSGHSSCMHSMNCYPKIKSSLSAARPLACSRVSFSGSSVSRSSLSLSSFFEADGICTNIRDPGPGSIIADICTRSSGSMKLQCISSLILFIAGIVQAFLLDKNKGIFLVTLTLLTFVISNFLSYRIPMQPRYLIFLAIVYFIAIALSYRLLFTLIALPGSCVRVYRLHGGHQRPHARGVLLRVYRKRTGEVFQAGSSR